MSILHQPCYASKLENRCNVDIDVELKKVYSISFIDDL